MRDSADAAALATQAYGAPAGAVPGIYGALMRVGGSRLPTRLRGGTDPRTHDQSH